MLDSDCDCTTIDALQTNDFSLDLNFYCNGTMALKLHFMYVSCAVL